MTSNTYILSYMIFFVIPMARGGKPGTYFWRPRLGIDLAIPTTEPAPGTVHQPTKDNIREGKVVMVDGYQMGMTLLGIATGLSAMKPYPHLNPASAYYYTNVYRWALRYLSLIPFWAGGNGGHISETHKTWKRRFYYMDEMVPEWLKFIVPYVPKESWDRHDLDHRRFKAHSESAFAYPRAPEHNFTRDNVENGHVVIIDGYNVGASVIALASNIFDESHEKSYPHLTPNTAHFFTNLYRWSARYLSLVPNWLGSRTETYPTTHQVWDKRFHYMTNLVPKWMRMLLPFVDKEEWRREWIELQRYHTFAEETFGKHYLYPQKNFQENLEKEILISRQRDYSDRWSDAEFD